MRLFRHPAFKWLVTFFLLAILAYQLWSRSNHFENLRLISFDKTIWWFVLVLLMMPANWLLESAKWRTLLKIHLPVSFFQTIKAVMGGVALAIFTPSRIGEYGGRILFMPAQSKWPVAISTLVGSMAQNIIALSGGIFACLFLFKGWIVLKIAALLIMLMAFICFFNIRKVIQRVSSFNLHPIFKKLVLNLQYIDDYSIKVLITVLGFALARYLVYTTQFVLILHAFEPHIDPGVLFLGVSAVFLIQTLLPLPPVADVMARANIGLILWSDTGMSELSISLASLMVWLFNLLIPAIIGSFAIGTTTHKFSLDNHESILSSDHMSVAAEQPDHS